jgi:hypothetical protein
MAMPTTLAEFKRFFAIGDGSTALLPSQSFVYHVPKNKKVVITDIYLQNVSVGDVSFLMLEQTGANTYTVRYRFFVRSNQTLSVNFSTGLRFGHEGPLYDAIRLVNDDIGTGGQVVPIVCGRLVG